MRDRRIPPARREGRTPTHAPLSDRAPSHYLLIIGIVLLAADVAIAYARWSRCADRRPIR
ncbi:hypothetical protein ACFWA5_00945 [Streptomyces mirabilis]|uniref:hypothetical protein n=1 Tax=Streptomyces mirabilis TaxID=68239 RepID=UPI00364E8E6C